MFSDMYVYEIDLGLCDWAPRLATGYVFEFAAQMRLAQPEPRSKFLVGDHYIAQCCLCSSSLPPPSLWPKHGTARRRQVAQTLLLS